MRYQPFSENRVQIGASVWLEFCSLTDRLTHSLTHTHTYKHTYTHTDKLQWKYNPSTILWRCNNYDDKIMLIVTVSLYWWDENTSCFFLNNYVVSGMWKYFRLISSVKLADTFCPMSRFCKGCNCLPFPFGVDFFSAFCIKSVVPERQHNNK